MVGNVVSLATIDFDFILSMADNNSILGLIFYRQYHYTYIHCVIDPLQLWYQLWQYQDHSQNYHHAARLYNLFVLGC